MGIREKPPTDLRWQEAPNGTGWQDEQDTATNKNLSRKRPRGTSGTAGRDRVPTPFTPPQMVTSASPITKPPTESPTETSTESPPKPTIKSPFKSSPTYVHKPPTISIPSSNWYSGAASTMRDTIMFLSYRRRCWVGRNIFCNFWFGPENPNRMLNDFLQRGSQMSDRVSNALGKRSRSRFRPMLFHSKQFRFDFCDCVTVIVR